MYESLRAPCAGAAPPLLNQQFLVSVAGQAAEGGGPLRRRPGGGAGQRLPGEPQRCAPGLGLDQVSGVLATSGDMLFQTAHGCRREPGLTQVHAGMARKAGPVWYFVLNQAEPGKYTAMLFQTKQDRA